MKIQEQTRRFRDLWKLSVAMAEKQIKFQCDPNMNCKGAILTYMYDSQSLTSMDFAMVGMHLKMHKECHKMITNEDYCYIFQGHD